MEFSSPLDSPSNSWIDDMLVWPVASATAAIGLVGVVNALNLFFDVEAG